MTKEMTPGRAEEDMDMTGDYTDMRRNLSISQMRSKTNKMTDKKTGFSKEAPDEKPVGTGK